jgi:leader peptidase (prepilin peptidase)/N-methyltransferase
VGAESPILIGAAASLGLIFGSLATVVAHRVPRQEPFVFGRSHCPACGHTLSAGENVPVLSYLVQRGRCVHCETPISARYPLVELATAMLFGLAAARFGASLLAVVYAAFLWVLVVLTVIDIDHHLLPSRIVYPALVVGWIGLIVATIWDGDTSRLVDALLGALIFGGFMFVVAIVYPAGMGGGDVRLAFVLGTFLGYLDAPGLVLVGMFLSFVLGAVIGVVTMKVKGGNRKMHVPFGPSLALGTVVAIFVGRSLLEAYLSI